MIDREGREIYIMKNYYEILGINRNVAKGEIKNAYRNLAKKWHPDACKEPEAHSRFIEITEAYEILSDDVKRSNYDGLYAESRNQFSNSQSAHRDSNSYYGTNNSQYNQYEQDAYEARGKAETYYGMPIEQFLAQVLGVVVNAAKDTVKYTILGDQDVKLSFGERIGIGFNMTILIILGVLSFTGILAPITLPLALATIRTLMYKGQYIGIGKLISSTILFICMVIGILAVIIATLGGL